MVACVIFIHGFSRCRGLPVLDLSVLLSIFVCIYICSADYVGLPVLLYLLQCLVYHMLPKMRRSSGYKVVGEVLVLGLLVVYKIPYSRCM